MNEAFDYAYILVIAFALSCAIAIVLGIMVYDTFRDKIKKR